MKNTLILIAVLLIGVITTTAQTNWQDVELSNADCPTNTFVVDGNRIHYYTSSFKILDVTDDGCRIAVYNKDGDLDLDTDRFIYGLGGLSDRTYKLSKALVKVDNYTYKTVLGGSRTIPAYRYATDAELDTIQSRLDSLKQQKFFNLTNRVFFISEMQASNNIANNVKLPVGYTIYITNSVRTNLFKP